MFHQADFCFFIEDYENINVTSAMCFTSGIRSKDPSLRNWLRTILSVSLLSIISGVSAKIKDFSLIAKNLISVIST